MKRILIAATLFIVCHPALSMLYQAPEPKHEPEHIERIEVLGQKTKPQLQREFLQAKLDFLDLFNELNDIEKFTVDCHYHRPVGSRIAKKECEPRYVKEERAYLISLAFAVRTGNLNYARGVRGPTDAVVRLNTEHQRRQAYRHLAKLIQENEGLQKKWEKLAALDDLINDQ